jgi:hypothetical protein
LRLATERDLPAVVTLLADDALGATREKSGLSVSPTYLAAFRTIEVARITRSWWRTTTGTWMEEAVERARGCHLVQLTTDRCRPDALRFHENFGFVASHVGLEPHLGRSATDAPKRRAPSVW